MVNGHPSSGQRLQRRQLLLPQLERGRELPRAPRGLLLDPRLAVRLVEREKQGEQGQVAQGQGLPLRHVGLHYR